MSGFLASVLAGLVSGAIVILWQRLRRSSLNARHFGPLKGAYTVASKFPDQKHHEAAKRVTVTVSDATLTVTGECMPEGHALHGEIRMSETFRTTGEGWYQHDKGNERLWGFWKITVRGEHVIQVHHSYARKTEALITQAFVWERVTDAPASERSHSRLVWPTLPTWPSVRPLWFALTVAVLLGVGAAWLTRYVPLPPSPGVVVRVWDRWTHRLCERALDGSSHCLHIRLPANPGLSRLR